MADRACPSCGAVASDRLKFCRDCGARLEDGPAAASPPAAPSVGETVVGANLESLAGASVDETVVSGRAARAAPPAPAADPDATAIGTAAALAGASVDRTVVSGAAVPSAPPADTPPSGVPSPDETVIGGLKRPLPSDTPVPEESDGGGTRTSTILGPVPGMPAPSPPAPPPPPPPAREEDEEPEPEFDDDDATGETLLAPSPAAPPPVVPPPPPPPPPPAAAAAPAPAAAPAAPRGAARRAFAELEHWSPTRKHTAARIEKPEVWVGRDRGDFAYPDDGYLSRKHARFYVEPDGRLFVEDAGTLNGTYLRVRERVALEHRDVVCVGRHVLRFELLEFDEEDQRTMEGDPLTRVQGVQGTPPRARLVKRQEEGFRGTPFYFGAKRYVLGRTEGTHRFTTDDRMSRRHAQIEYAEGKYWLEDLGSQNGTFLRVQGPRALDKGDVVRMGDQHFKVL